jgi:translation initiation factor 2B subunit (eIF-2B alpha/beta/delta family)
MSNKINWFHISDLHFGAEQKSNEPKQIRSDLLKYVETQMQNINYRYLFVTGDIFYAPIFYSRKNHNIKTEIIKAATKFFEELIHLLRIQKEDVFIVPGNHDTDRHGEEKGKLVNELEASYIDIQELDEANVKKLAHYQHEFNNFCESLGVNYCSDEHKIVSKSLANVLMLNSALTSCKKDETARLLLCEDIFARELEKHKSSIQHPLFILSHHEIQCFTQKDQNNIVNHIKSYKKDGVSIFYLCGHNHYAQIKKIDEIPQFICGTDVRKEIINKNNKEKKVMLNKVSFITGSFDRLVEKTVAYFYTWDKNINEWREDRLRRNDYPYHAEIVFEGNSLCKTFNATSETVAYQQFLEYTWEELAKKYNKKDLTNQEKCDKYVSEIKSLLDILIRERPLWGSFSKFRDTFLLQLENLKGNKEDNISEYQKVIQVADEKIKQSKEIICRNTILKNHLSGNSDHFGILLYSKSTQVISYLLKGLESDIREKCTVYICSGCIRSTILYEDACDIAADFRDPNKISPKYYFNGYRIVLIPDIYVDALIKQGKINVVLLGAHRLYADQQGYTHFSNTVGSGLIVKLANERKVHCIIVADQTKVATTMPPDEIYGNEKEFNKFAYIDKKLIESVSAEFLESELVFLNDLDKMHYTIVTDATSDSPWKNYRFLTEDTVRLFVDTISKDRRRLSIIQGEQIIRKEYSDTHERDIESQSLTLLKKVRDATINVPDIVKSGEKYINMKYYKGIRVFNVLILIAQLMEDFQTNDQKNMLRSIVKELLQKCENIQKKIQKHLADNFTKNVVVNEHIYPKEKLFAMIDLFFMCFKLENKWKNNVIEEMEHIYKIFSSHAIVPFRDASTKNMIFACPELYLGNYKDGGDEERKTKLKKLFEKDQLRSILLDNKIINIDFSLCVHFTTSFDDEIGFKFHEKTSSYYDYKTDINNWYNYKSDTPINRIIAATFIVRYLRFGGRKALYRIVDPQSHNIRFKYDNETYYFRELPNIIKYYWTNAEHELPYTLKMLNAINNALNSGEISVIASSTNKNIKDMINSIMLKPTYSDVYPY